MDRIIHIVKKLSSEKFPEQLVDDAVCYYQDHNVEPTVNFLVTQKNLSQEDAEILVCDIHEEWMKVHLYSAGINAVGTSIFLVFFIIGIYKVIWYFILFGFLFGVLRIFTVVALLRHISRRKRNMINI